MSIPFSRIRAPSNKFENATLLRGWSAFGGRLRENGSHHPFVGRAPLPDFLEKNGRLKVSRPWRPSAT